jgi:purine-binding chemotaxis protein CheW
MNAIAASADSAELVPAGAFGASEVSAAPTKTQSISFAIGDDQYGVDIMAVREIKGWSDITHLPKQPDYVRGVLNLRGVIVPIIDLRCRFGQGLTEASPLHVIIIVQIATRQVGLLADRVLDIVSFEPSPGAAGAEGREILARRLPVWSRYHRGRDAGVDRPAEPSDGHGKRNRIIGVRFHVPRDVKPTPC